MIIYLIFCLLGSLSASSEVAYELPTAMLSLSTVAKLHHLADIAQQLPKRERKALRNRVYTLASTEFPVETAEAIEDYLKVLIPDTFFDAYPYELGILGDLPFEGSFMVAMNGIVGRGSLFHSGMGASHLTILGGLNMAVSLAVFSGLLVMYLRGEVIFPSYVAIRHNLLAVIVMHLIKAGASMALSHILGPLVQLPLLVAFIGWDIISYNALRKARFRKMLTPLWLQIQTAATKPINVPDFLAALHLKYFAELNQTPAAEKVCPRFAKDMIEALPFECEGIFQTHRKKQLNEIMATLAPQ